MTFFTGPQHTPVTREQYLWLAKRRARVYLDAGDLLNAVKSMVSDLDNRADTGPVNTYLVLMALMSARRHDRAGVSRFIEGFH